MTGSRSEHGHSLSAQLGYLAGRAVGHAGALVVGQVEVGGTGTLVASAGREQAQVAAAAIVGLTGVVEHWEERRGRKFTSNFRIRKSIG